ncbi:hypothetical protein FQA39_LY03469 [Lamprigera yunnana]|nr:hypothetical protein FQA39_LY03469 [Lamprigera yunnana]
MPRTKRLLKENDLENIKPSKPQLARGMVNHYLNALDKHVSVQKINSDSKAENLLAKVDSTIAEHFLKLSQYRNMKIGELKNINAREHTTLYERTMKNATMSTTRGRAKRSRSFSVGKKGGMSKYTSQSVVKKMMRTSRSLSRSKQANAYRTPMNLNIPPASSYALITPKVKPNTPQVLLRRPTQGEMAVSMQGSPLLVDHILPNKKANVNIPLLDGRVFSILPEKGLRSSLIPNIDPSLRKQIETLRDNLSKVLKQ